MVAILLSVVFFLATAMISSRWLPTVWQQRLENVKKTLFEKGKTEMKNIIWIGLAALAMWVVSMFGGDKKMSLDYIPRAHMEDRYYGHDDMEGMFRDWAGDHEGDNSLDYRSRDGGRSSSYGNHNNTLDYRGRSSRTGRYVRR